MTITVDEACEILHSTYEDAAAKHGWATNIRSRVPWDALPEANRATMREAVGELLKAIRLERERDVVAAHHLPEVCFRQFDKQGLPMHVIGDPGECPCKPDSVTNEHGRVIKIIHHKLEEHNGTATA